jgi:REP element-mobilizing transposase RayT
MKHDPDIHDRKPIRLQEYDYANQGAYYVTICTWNRECIFGDVIKLAMQLNSFGDIVLQCWQDLPNHYRNIELDEFVIMPNHLHGIIWINGDIARAGLKPAPTHKRHGLPEIIRALKTFSSRQINQLRHTPGIPVWQRTYFDRIIRNETELYKIREYIRNNPLQWELDENNPVNVQGQV